MNSKISSFSRPRGIPIPALTGAFGGLAPTVAHVVLRWLLRSLVLTFHYVTKRQHGAKYGSTGRESL